MPAPWGRLVVHPAGSSGPDGRLFDSPQPHARLADGRTVIWDWDSWGSACPGLASGQSHRAVDAESLGTLIPGYTGALIGGDSEVDSLTRWTRLEVVAKLAGVPVLLLLRNGAPDLGDWVLRTIVWRDVVVSVGFGACCRLY